jgi:glycosyltransferase involved in cell wall biosynthesis
VSKKAKPKIAFFYDRLVAGGIEANLCRLTQWIAEKRPDWEIDLVLARAEGELLSQVSPKVRIVDLKAKPILLTKRLRLGYMLPATPKLVRYLKAEHPDALFAFYIANFPALWGRWLSGVSLPVIISERVHPTLSAQISANLLDRLMPLLKRLFYPHADVIIAVSHGVADDLSKVTRIPRERIRVIYNPVVTPDILRKAEETVEHPWFSDSSHQVILGVGRLCIEKDFPTLIKAFALIRQKRPAKLVILGEGEERPRLEALVKELGIENDVWMPGFVDNPFKFMAKASVFVLSSAWEALPTVLIEALACGCPVVSTDCPSGPAEILEGGKWGKLVPVGDYEKLAEAILETIENPPDREKLKQRGMDFHIDKIGQEWLNLIAEMLKIAK